MKKFTKWMLLGILLSNVAWAQPTCITLKGSFLAATSEELFDEAMNYAVTKDIEALQILMDSGQVFMLKEGVRVQAKRKGIFSGKMKIRPIGSTVWFWTVVEAVNCS